MKKDKLKKLEQVLKDENLKEEVIYEDMTNDVQKFLQSIYFFFKPEIRGTALQCIDEFLFYELSVLCEKYFDIGIEEALYTLKHYNELEIKA